MRGRRVKRRVRMGVGTLDGMRMRGRLGYGEVEMLLACRGNWYIFLEGS